MTTQIINVYYNLSKSGGDMSFRLYIGKFLLGLVAFIWTACSSDSGTGANEQVPTSSAGDLTESSSSQGDSSSSVEQSSSSFGDSSSSVEQSSSSFGDLASSCSRNASLTREDFFNADSLIAEAKQPKMTTDTCVTVKNYCETLTGEIYSGSKVADALFEKRIDDILNSPKAETLTERCKSYLQEKSKYFFAMTHPTTVYGVSPCYAADDYFSGDSTIHIDDPYIFEKINIVGICGDGVRNHVKVDSTYLNKEKVNAERYANDFENAVNYFLENIEEECK